jgi:hypothetical protein
MRTDQGLSAVIESYYKRIYEQMEEEVIGLTKKQDFPSMCFSQGKVEGLRMAFEHLVNAMKGQDDVRT